MMQNACHGEVTVGFKPRKSGRTFAHSIRVQVFFSFFLYLLIYFYCTNNYLLSSRTQTTAATTTTMMEKRGCVDENGPNDD